MIGDDQENLSCADMHCPACVVQLEGIEDNLAGIRRIKASYHRQKMEVEFAERQVTEEQIVAAARQCGYEAVAV